MDSFKVNKEYCTNPLSLTDNGKEVLLCFKLLELMNKKEIIVAMKKQVKKNILSKIRDAKAITDAIEVTLKVEATDIELKLIRCLSQVNAIYTEIAKLESDLEDLPF